MADALITIPQAAAIGVKDAHTDTLHQLAQEVIDTVKDPSIDEPQVLRWFNRCLGEMVTTLARRGVYLPSLATSGEVETMTATEAVALPADWHGNLHGAWDNATGHAIKVRPWSALQRMRGPGPLRHGQLVGVATFARQLRYWLVPHAPRRLTIQYHRLPAPLVALTDKPFDLPPEVASAMLVDFACATGFATNEQEQNDNKINTTYHRNRFAAALDDLAIEVGPWPTEATPITDEMGWGCV
ncbi:hypothetical protein K9F62_03050 [Desulfovibrio sp. JY]|nr:hypothetical protein K9F62_03050 [Desulfovibrio sp. JY]